MSQTSTAAKRRYNDKTYTRWVVDLRNEEFKKIESMRGDMSRAQFLRHLISKYGEEDDFCSKGERRTDV